jgi:Zn-dependent peptidase ImmA (M78 family)
MSKTEPSLAAARLEASLIIRHYGFRSPEEIELEDIAFQRGITIKSAHLNKVEALLLRKAAKGIICVSDRDMELGRRRFAIAHELGHWHCHKNISQAWLCTADSIHAYKGSSIEKEANAFAAELLMPKCLLLPRLDNQPLSIKQVCEIADEFKTTLTATAVRLVEESKDDCCVVFSDRNAIRWSRKSSSADQVWLPQAISADSRTWDCDTEPQDSRGPRKVSCEAWLSGRALQDYSEVWEEAVFLPKYQTAITLLSFM